MKASHLITKRLTFIFITDCVAEIRQLAQTDRLLVDKVQQRFVEHTLQIAIQAMIDVAFAIASESNLGEPTENSQAFARLVGAGWISPELGDTCRRMVDFRNVAVRDYLKVDPTNLLRIVERDLDEMLGFVRAIRDKLSYSTVSEVV